MPVFTPEGVEEKLVEAINAGDLHSAIALFEGGATVVFTDGGTVTGGVAIREGLGERLAAKPQITSELVSILQGDGIAVAHYKWSLTSTGSDGSSSTSSGLSDHLLRRQLDRSWRIAALNRGGAGAG